MKTKMTKTDMKLLEESKWSRCVGMKQYRLINSVRKLLEDGLIRVLHLENQYGHEFLLITSPTSDYCPSGFKRKENSIYE